MAKIDPREFLLNSDYEMDKIIYFHEEERTVSGYTTVSFPHNLRTVPLVFGIWSNNPDFSNSHEINDYGLNPWSPDLICSATADLTNINLTLIPKYENNQYVSTTFYIRIFGFEPYDEHKQGLESYNLPKITFQKIPPTSKYAKQFIINTDYNYLKLLKAGGSIGNYQNPTYVHNLGYVPQVMTWNTLGWDTDDNNITFSTSGGFSYSDIPGSEYIGGTLVNEKNLWFYDGGIVPSEIEFRLYGDEV